MNAFSFLVLAVGIVMMATLSLQRPATPALATAASAAGLGSALGQCLRGLGSALFEGLALAFMGKQTTSGGGYSYKTPFDGKIQDVGVQTKISPSDTDYDDYIDADGYLKPGTLLQADLTPVSGVDQTVVYLVATPTKVAFSDAAGDRTQDQFVALFTEGRLSRQNIEWNLERALSANELAAIASSRFTLVG